MYHYLAIYISRNAIISNHIVTFRTGFQPVIPIPQYRELDLQIVFAVFSQWQYLVL